VEYDTYTAYLHFVLIIFTLAAHWNQDKT